MKLGLYQGWRGIHSRDQVPGAIKNGTRVRKVWSEPGDTNEIGAEATIIGSIYHHKAGLGYFVEWDAWPHAAVFVVAKKIAPVTR